MDLEWKRRSEEAARKPAGAAIVPHGRPYRGGITVLGGKIFPKIARRKAGGRAYRQETVLPRTTVDEVVKEFALASSAPPDPRRRRIVKAMDWPVMIRMTRKDAGGPCIVDHPAIGGEDPL